MGTGKSMRVRCWLQVCFGLGLLAFFVFLTLVAWKNPRGMWEETGIADLPTPWVRAINAFHSTVTIGGSAYVMATGIGKLLSERESGKSVR